MGCRLDKGSIPRGDSGDLNQKDEVSQGAVGGLIEEVAEVKNGMETWKENTEVRQWKETR